MLDLINRARQQDSWFWAFDCMLNGWMYCLSVLRNNIRSIYANSNHNVNDSQSLERKREELLAIRIIMMNIKLLKVYRSDSYHCGCSDMKKWLLSFDLRFQRRVTIDTTPPLCKRNAYPWHDIINHQYQSQSHIAIVD